MDDFDNVLVIDADGHVSEATSISQAVCRKNGDRRRPSK